MKTSIFERYLGSSIYQGTVFVLCGFLAMFMFFDFLAELDEVGIGGYRLTQAFFVVLLGIPSRIYELAPIAALIGTLWALSQSAANSEFTVFRVSGLLPGTALKSILRIGAPMIVITAIVAELVVPHAEEFKGRVRDGSIAVPGAGQMRSGLWLRDAPEISVGATKEMRFVNASRYTKEQILQGVQIYDFDRQQRLTQTLRAESARYVGFNRIHQWELKAVEQTVFLSEGRVTIRKIDRMVMDSLLSPEMLGALVTNPDRMSSLDLFRYVQYLKQNKQQSERYEIALWKRLIYPFAIWVMMFLALPVAFLQARSGVVGSRVFLGILVGVGFHLLNSLFSHLGVLNTWPAPMMAMLPSAIALMVAGFFFYWVQHR